MVKLLAGAGSGARMLFAWLAACAIGPRPALASALSEQDRLEERALEIAQSPVVKAARQEAAARLLAALPADRLEDRAEFDRTMDEIAFYAILNAVNSDVYHPAVVTLGRVPRMARGKMIPGSRYLIDNPDQFYRMFPIDGAETYLIHGSFAAGRPAMENFSIWTRSGAPVANLSDAELKVGADGSYTILLGPSPAPENGNRLSSTPDAEEVFIRDTLLDWSKDRPAQLRVERIGGAPRAPISNSEIARRAAALLARCVRDVIAVMQPISAKEPNTFGPGQFASAYQALPSQGYSNGRFLLAPGEMLVLTVHTGGARYISVPVTNRWGMTREPDTRTSTMNSNQARPNPDGSYTYVISPTDPGLANWVDTAGRLSGTITVRWLGAPGSIDEAAATVQSRLVTGATLKAALPPGTSWLTPEERKAQRQARSRAYAWRRK